MVFTDVAQTAGDHDRLVIAAHFVTVGTRYLLFKGTEVTGQVGTAEFVVERSTTDRAFNHDIQRRRDALRLAIAGFPGLLEAWDVQIGYGETGQARLRLGATAGSTLITYFTAGAGRGTGKRRDCSRVVVGFHLHQNMNRFRVVAVLTSGRMREETTRLAAHDDGRVILVGGQYIFATQVIGVADHGEQGMLLTHAIDIPAG